MVARSIFFFFNQRRVWHYTESIIAKRNDTISGMELFGGILDAQMNEVGRLWIVLPCAPVDSSVAPSKMSDRLHL